MFLNGWKRKSIKRNIEKLVANSAGPSVSSEIITLGVILDNSAFSDLKPIREIVGELGQSLQTEVLLYENGKNEDVDNEVIIQDDSLGWNGKIVDDNVSNFVAKPFDLLLSYYNTENLVLQFITAHSAARFKAGFHMQKYQLHDLTIDVDIKDTTAFKTELKKYLKILNRIP